MTIKASEVKLLREKTGLGMMECKKALIETNGDFENALELINKYQCIEDTITRANHFSNVAIDSIDTFNNNIFKEKLVSIVSKSISRIY